MRYTDMHCDTLEWAFFHDRKDIWDLPETMFDFRRFREAGGAVQFTAVFFPPEGIPDDLLYFDTARKTLLDTVAAHSDVLSLVRGRDSYLEAVGKGKSAALLTLEDGRAIGGRHEMLDHFYERDVRLITLTWNFENCLGFPNSSDPEVMRKGLKPFGKETVERMASLGMIVDVSHLSDGGFHDVADIVRGPFLASHSDCRALSPNQRNLTDRMIRILAEHGGIMGMNFYPPFLDPSEDPVCTAEIIVRHMRHAADVGGTGVVALGTDFDGISGRVEVSSPGSMELLWDAMKRGGFTEEEIDRIAFGNADRFLKDVLK